MTNRDPNSLTPRERQVLEGLLRGNTIRQIADSYGLGKQTVKNYATTIYEKLGVQGRSQLLQCSGVHADAHAPFAVSHEA